MTLQRGLRLSRQAAKSRERQPDTTPEQQSAQAEENPPDDGSFEEADRTVRAPEKRSIQPRGNILSAQAVTPASVHQHDVADVPPTQQALAPVPAGQEEDLPDELVPREASSAERMPALKRLLQQRFCRVAGITLDQLPSVLHSEVDLPGLKLGFLTCQAGHPSFSRQSCVL